MITSQQVDELARLHPERFPVTTLFLRLDSGPDKRKAEIQLKDLIKRERVLLAGRELEREQLASVEQDFTALGQFVQHLDRKGHRALAAFSSAGVGLWRTHLLAQPVRDRLVVDAHPHVRPLSRLLNQLKRCLVIRIARDRAALDWAHLGELTPIESRTGDVPPDLKAGGFAGTEERRIERRAEDRRLHFAKELGERSRELLQGDSGALFLLGGAAEVVSAFEAALPRGLRSRLVGRIPVGPESGAAEVLAQVTAALTHYERSRAAGQAEQAVRDAEHGGRGVAGIPASLRAFARGQAATILVAQGLARPGLACSHCSALVLAGERCPECGGDLFRVPDLVEELIHRAAGHHVEVVDVEEPSPLAACGGMAALLHFRAAASDGGPIQVTRETSDK
jgi:peptide subunit release factor 1 (eRF1)